MSGSSPSKGDRISEYILEERLGAGGFGEVWKAVHAFLPDEVVAVKIPTDPDFIENLRREGAILHALKGEHIVAVKGLDPYADPPYLAMEYVAGKSLRQLLDDMAGKGMPLDDAADIFRQCLLALETAHSQGVIHRDVKPSNVLIDETGVVKLADFGLGRASQAAVSGILHSGDLHTVGTGGVAGTLRYMSPEQREGGPVDPRTDLYSLGMVLFEMLIGEPPQGAEVPGDLNPDLPKWVDQVFSRCYTRLEKRFADASEARQALEEMMPEKARPDVVFLGDVKQGPRPPLRIPPAPVGKPRPLWMLPFFGLHALFEGLGSAVGGTVRSIRDGGGAAGLSVLFLTLLAAGGLLMLAKYASPVRIDADQIRTRDVSARGLDGAFRGLGRAYERQDWREVWNGLSNRARMEIAEVAGYHPAEGRWRLIGWRILDSAMKEYDLDDPPGVLAHFIRVKDVGPVSTQILPGSRARVRTGGQVTEWVRQDGVWKLDGPAVPLKSAGRSRSPGRQRVR